MEAFLLNVQVGYHFITKLDPFSFLFGFDSITKKLHLITIQGKGTHTVQKLLATKCIKRT